MRVRVLGVGFDNITMSEAVSRAVELAGSQGTHYVVTPNPEIVNMGREMPDYRDILNGASLVLPDGIGVIHAAKILGTPLKERVPGIDFATGLLSELEQSGGRLFLLGAKPGVADQAAENLKQKYPKLTICGTNDGYFKDSAPVVEKIKAAQAGAVDRRIWPPDRCSPDGGPGRCAGCVRRQREAGPCHLAEDGSGVGLPPDPPAQPLRPYGQAPPIPGGCQEGK